jgi:general secretion pathway protein I
MRGPSNRGPREEGFTLIELIVAMGLLAVAVTAVYQLQAESLNLHAEARFATEASQIARARLARITGREVLVEGAESGVFGEEDGTPSPFVWEETVQEVAGRDRLFRVEVRVLVKDGNGKAVRSLAVETLQYRFGGSS